MLICCNILVFKLQYVQGTTTTVNFNNILKDWKGQKIKKI